jgi:DNA-binding cell septation regulator SpoVG
METTPLDGYKKIIVTLLTLIAGSLGLFITDPAKAQTVGQFLIDVIGPVAITLVGIIYTIVQGNIDKEKVKAAPKIAAITTAATSEANAAPKAESVAAQQPVVAPSLPAAPVDTYTPFDIDAAVGAAEESCRKDGQEVTPVSRAFYFYHPTLTNFDLREVPKAKRICEAKRLVDKAVELFVEAFKYQTKLPKPPTLAEANNYHVYMLKLKKDYEKANNLACSDQTFEDLRSLISYFNELYNAQDGLAQLTGKTVDWSTYSGKSYGPLQVGWDYVKLL